MKSEINPNLMKGSLLILNRRSYPFHIATVRVRFELIRGNIISDEKFEGEKFIFEIPQTNDHPAASFIGFLYDNEQLVGNLRWVDDRVYELRAKRIVRNNSLLRFDGNIETKLENDQKFILVLLPNGSPVKLIDVNTGL
ncbi:MAG: hypothetical protein KF763_01910 [Cyclobacteriaceae bacterium]|nr:hypothetical protein [Cyclobacteriaceae bacterium]